MKAGFVQTEISTGSNADDNAFFANALANPPIPADATLAQARDRLDALASLNPAIPAGVTVTHVDANGASADLLTPPNARAKRAIIYARGGSFTMGRTPGIWLYPIYHIAHFANVVALIVNYRLAPEHPFPAARNDVVSAYDYLLQHGYEPSHIVLCGDSSGGGLVMQAVLAIRDAGKPTPAGVVTIGAWIDLANEGETRTANPPDALALLDNLKAMAALYLGSTDAKDPRANPLYADLSGLPPLRLMVGSLEALRDDSTRLADAAGAYGVDVKVEVWHNLHHGWYLFSNHIKATERTYQRFASFVAELISADASQPPV
jgi:epsilon-lactone hydrolase